jgi:hypothetical protein
MAGFAKFLGLKVESLYFWLYGRAIQLDETVSDVYYNTADTRWLHTIAMSRSPAMRCRLSFAMSGPQSQPYVTST